MKRRKDEEERGCGERMEKEKARMERKEEKGECKMKDAKRGNGKTNLVAFESAEK